MIRFQATKQLDTSDGPQRLEISFQLAAGQTLALYGPSGAGKTTILRILAGLTKPDTGIIQVNNQTWFDKEETIDTPITSRSIGMVFQDFALFPNLTVRQNLEYALQTKSPDSAAFIDDLLDIIELKNLQHRHPAHLSGGQQQRTALARAIARKPSLLLLDEPLSAIDDEMRVKLQDYIIEARRRYNLTTILVSHNIPEILRLADKVCCIEKGRVIKQGSPEEIFPQACTAGIIAKNDHSITISLPPDQLKSFAPGQTITINS